MHQSKGKLTMFWTKWTLCVLFVVLVLALEQANARPRTRTKSIKEQANARPRTHTKIIKEQAHARPRTRTKIIKDNVTVTFLVDNIRIHSKYVNFGKSAKINYGNVKLSEFQIMPRNQATYNNSVDLVGFSCQPTDKAEIVTWSRQLDGADREDTIAIDGAIAPGYETKYTMINATTIALLNPTLNDGQRLRCGLVDATVSAHAYLMVINSGPGVCSLSQMYLGEEGTYRCDWSYQGLNGLWPPSMQCFEHPSGQLLPSRNMTTNTQKVEYISEFVVEEHLDGQQLGWQAYYESPPTGALPEDDLQNAYSKSVPDLVHTYIHSQVSTVWRGPHQVHIYPKSSQYTVGDVITCTAVANHLPTFHWAHDDETQILSNSSALTITQNMVGMSGKFICVANNWINTWAGKGTESVNATIKVTTDYKEYFTKWPVNQVTLIGEPYQANCTPVSTTDALYWATQLESSSDEANVIYDGVVLEGYEELYGVVDHSNILVKVAEAQRLKCGLVLAAISIHAFLITLEEEPVCRHNLTSVNDIQNGTGVHIYCQVTYNGLWAPVMTWGTMKGYGDNWSLDAMAVSESFDKTVRSSIYLSLTTSHDKEVFMCKTHFLPPPDGLLPDDDGNTVFNRQAPSWTYYYKAERFYVA